ncbi:phosphoglycolate phosphatase [Rhizobium helianthi]|uniref:Phosphoglycolate phosphatase n=1 Tax=Rhizobium helianthi TaxID=1132695 RepID=A0ABW4M0Y6_9HYPH
MTSRKAPILSAPLVIFDLDGTMIDTAHDLIDSLNYTIAARDLAPVTFEDLTHLVGQGARVMIRRAFALREQPIDDSEVESLLERFLGHYKEHMPGKSRAYDGLEACLDRLQAAGYAAAVCTNKMEELALPLLEKLSLTSRFSAITGGDTFAVRKPDAAHILGTIERAGALPARSIMIGDSINDIMAARNAGVPSIGVTFGYSDVPVAELKPDHVISHFDELTPELVSGLLAHRN